MNIIKKITTTAIAAAMAATAFVATPATASDVGWIELGTNGYGQQVFVNFDSIERLSGPHVVYKAWVLSGQRVTSDTVYLEIHLMEVNCTTKDWWYHESLEHYVNDAGQRVVTKEVTHQPPLHIGKAKPEHMIYRSLCTGA